MTPPPPPATNLRGRLHEVIFEADTASGRAFDVVLIWLILLSVLAVCLESVASVRARHGALLYAVEWVFTVAFTIEYALRIYCLQRPRHYVLSFFGIIDLLAIVPTYLSLFVPGAQSLIVIRSLRLLRVFRVLKLAKYLGEANQLAVALRSSRPKITIFVGTVLSVAVIAGALMYIIEGEAAGFTSIPVGVYWAIVTMTTVGYGDIAPQTVLGQTVASMLMVLGYGIIAVPTGIVSAEMVQAKRKGPISTQACPACAAEGHDSDAKHCKYCGALL